MNPEKESSFSRLFVFRRPLRGDRTKEGGLSWRGRLIRMVPLPVVAAVVPLILLVILPLFLTVAYLLCLVFAPLWYYLLLRALIRLERASKRGTIGAQWWGGQEEERTFDDHSFFSRN